jgi:single-strand DNA-binding protein
MNQCVLSGNLGADPEVAYSSEGVPWATFSLAFKSGPKKTNWIKVVCFNRSAEIAQTYLHKGAKVLVTGYLEQNKTDGENSKAKSSFRLIAQAIEFIKTDGRGFENGKTDEVPF